MLPGVCVRLPANHMCGSGGVQEMDSYAPLCSFASTQLLNSEERRKALGSLVHWQGGDTFI